MRHPQKPVLISRCSGEWSREFEYIPIRNVPIKLPIIGDCGRINRCILAQVPRMAPIERYMY